MCNLQHSWANYSMLRHASMLQHWLSYSINMLRDFSMYKLPEGKLDPSALSTLQNLADDTPNLRDL